MLVAKRAAIVVLIAAALALAALWAREKGREAAKDGHAAPIELYDPGMERQ